MFAPAERAVLAYTDCLAGQQGSMPREVTDPVKTFLDDETVFELTYITALHGMHAVIARALRLEFVARHFLTAPTPPAR